MAAFSLRPLDRSGDIVPGQTPSSGGSAGRPRPAAKLAKGGGALACLLLALITGCASPPLDPEERAEYDNNADPVEPANREIFAANQAADHAVIRPIAQAYKDNVPGVVQTGIHNFVGNLGQPVIAANDALQGNFGRALNTTLRFAVNTTAGAGGVFDVATGWNLPEHYADFGQTFGVWGIPAGPFVVLPLLGPSNVRDSVGRAVGYIADPFGSFVGFVPLTIIGYARSGLGVVDTRSGLLDASDALEKTSLDYYAALRSLYAQQRATAIAEGRNPDAPASPSSSTSSAVAAPFSPGVR